MLANVVERCSFVRYGVVEGGVIYIFLIIFVFNGAMARDAKGYRLLVEKSVQSAMRALDAVANLSVVDGRFQEMFRRGGMIRLPEVKKIQSDRLLGVWKALQVDNIKKGSAPDISRLLVAETPDSEAPPPPRRGEKPSSHPKFDADLRVGQETNGKRHYWPYTRFVRHQNEKYPKRQAAYQAALDQLTRMVSGWKGVDSMVVALRNSGNKQRLAEILGFFAFANAVRVDLSYEDFAQHLPPNIQDRAERVFQQMPVINIENDVDSFFKSGVDHLLLLTYEKLKYAFEDGWDSFLEASIIASRGKQYAKFTPKVFPLLFYWQCFIHDHITHLNQKCGLWGHDLHVAGFYDVKMLPEGKIWNLLGLEGFPGMVFMGDERVLSSLKSRVAELVPPRTDALWFFQAVAGLASLDPVPPFILCLRQATDPLDVRCKLIRLMFWENAMCNISKILLRREVISRRHIFRAHKYEKGEEETKWMAKWALAPAVLAQRLGAGWEGIVGHSRVMNRLSVTRADALEAINPPLMRDLPVRFKLADEVANAGLASTMSLEEVRCLQWEWCLDEILESCDELVDDMGEKRGLDLIVSVLSNPQFDKGYVGKCSLVYAMDFWNGLCNGGVDLKSDMEEVQKLPGWEAQRRKLREILTAIIESFQGSGYFEICQANSLKIKEFVSKCTNNDKETKCIFEAVDLAAVALGGAMKGDLKKINWPNDDLDLRRYSVPNPEDWTDAAFQEGEGKFESSIVDLPQLRERVESTSSSDTEIYGGLLDDVDVAEQYAILEMLEEEKNASKVSVKKPSLPRTRSSVEACVRAVVRALIL